jgi:hypothetical protein
MSEDSRPSAFRQMTEGRNCVRPNEVFNLGHNSPPRSSRRGTRGAARSSAAVWVAVITFFTRHGSSCAQEAALEPPSNPSSISELAPASIPPDENAAWHLEQLRVAAEAFSTRQQDFLDSPLGVDYEAREDRGDLPTDEQIAGMAQVVERFSLLDEGIAAVATSETYVSRADYSGDPEKFTNSLLQQITAARGVARYLDWQVRVLAAAGDFDEATRRAIELLRLSRHLQNEPTCIGYLSGIAIRGVALVRLGELATTGRVSFSMRTTLDAELAALDDPQAFTRMLRDERAFALALAEEQFAERDKANLEAFGAIFGVGWSDGDLRKGLHGYFDAMIHASEGTWQEFHEQLRRTNHVLIVERYGPLAAESSPTIVAAVEAHERDVARVRALRIVNSLRIFAVVNKREATKVGELDLPGAALIDPCTGALLKVKHDEAGWTVYSVGRNGKDDGGLFHNLLDVGVGPSKARENR